MSIRHVPFFQLAYIIASLCPSVTWAYLPKRHFGVEAVHAAEEEFTVVSGYISTARSGTAATSSTLAPEWSSFTPQWSTTTAAPPNAAAQSSSVPPESNYQPASASPTNTSPPAAYTDSATTCTTYAPCNLFYQVSDSPKSLNVQLYLQCIVCYRPVLAGIFSTNSLPSRRDDQPT